MMIISGEKRSTLNLAKVWACIMFMALELDRANIAQALTDNFLPQLHLSINGQFNLQRSFPAWPFSNISLCRLQSRKHSLQGCLPLRRAAIPIGFQMDWTRSLDSSPNGALVNCLWCPILAVWSHQLLDMQSAARYNPGRIYP
jgi:hypothetical protein